MATIPADRSASGRSRGDAPGIALLREARRADIPGIQRVRAAVLENRLVSRVIADDEVAHAILRTGRGWVVELAGDVVAFAIGNAITGNIWALFVDPRFEGLGFGRQLQETMLDWLWSQGLQRLWLTTDAGTRAERFYRSTGWTDGGRSPGGEVLFERFAEPASGPASRRLVSSGSPFEQELAYSRAVVDGDWIFVSGTTGFDYATMSIAATAAEQAEQCFRNIRHALGEAGADLRDVVRVRYILPCVADFQECAAVLRRHLGDVRPAATMICAGLLDPRMKIEIEVAARRRGDGH